MSPLLLNRLRSLVARSRFFRFLISGGVNTGATYVIYLLLLQVLDYRVAYSVAYVFGIVLSFLVNRLFVFKTHRGWRSIVLFPFVYLVQYLVSVAVIWGWVEMLDLSATVAPLIAIAITIPLTYVLSRFVFSHRREAN